MARERSIVVRLRAEVADFKREMDAAAESARKVGQESKKSGEGAQTVLGGLVKSATQNRAAWTTTGTALAGFGAAVTGIGVAALKTGIEYNTLQQTARASLSTLLGSAQAANAQMDKLDDFARNSPFSKQVFITAQQQMLGFGVEAEKVIPALDAIQNAVAAMGGSNEDIASIVDALSKMQSQGKLSGETLKQLGTYGIDAATIIGEQMGLTGVEIRQMASQPGGLPADKVWDPLVQGMAQKFDGAAANVKNTFDGAIDRVKAAWRDLSADLAKPLVDPDGGGMLIDFANKVADVMRAVQKLPEPVKNTIAALGGLTGAAALTGGAMMILLPQFINTVSAVRTLRSDMPRLSSALGTVGKAAAALGALAILNSVGASVDRTVASTEEWINRLTNLKRSLDPLPDVFKEVKPPEDFSQFLEEVTDTSIWAGIDDAVGSFANNMANLIGIDARSEWTQQRDSLLELGDAMGQLANQDLEAAQTAFYELASQTDGTDDSIRNLLSIMPGYQDALYGAANAAGRQLTETELLDAATGKLDVTTGEAIDTADGYTKASHRSQEALKRERDAIVEKTKAYMDDINVTRDAMDATIKYELAVLDATEKIRENNEIMKKSKKGSEEYRRAELENRQALSDVTAEFSKRIEKMIEDGATQEDLNRVTRETREEFIKLAGNAGDTAVQANKLADSLGLIPGKYRADIVAETNAAQRRVDEFIRLNDGRVIRLKTTNVVSTTNSEVIRLPGVRGGGLTRAEGGHIPYGFGGPKQDNVPVWASSGEFVVRESSTRKHRALLEAINSDRMPAFANGGQVGAKYASQAPPIMTAAAPSLSGLAIEGTLDLGDGLVGVMRGVVRNELSGVALQRRAGTRS